MKIESVVKVMNFHSLLRVDSAKKNAERYFEYEKELTDFADNILNNRNLILDKKILKTENNTKQLNIYIANDLGFCGNFNSVINKAILKDKDSDKIIIGKKVIKNNRANVILAFSKEEYKESRKKLEEILYDSVKNQKHSQINVIYNHYYNISQLGFNKKKLLPLEGETGKDKYKEDFVIEGDINEILLNIIVLYLSYEIRIAEENSYASENIMRQMLTKESLRKIADMKEEKIKIKRKEIKNKSFKKALESFNNKNLTKENS